QPETKRPAVEEEDPECTTKDACALLPHNTFNGEKARLVAREREGKLVRVKPFPTDYSALESRVSFIHDDVWAFMTRKRLLRMLKNTKESRRFQNGSDSFRALSLKELHVNLASHHSRRPGHPGGGWCNDPKESRVRCLTDWIKRSSDAEIAASLANMVAECRPTISGERRQSELQLSTLNWMVANTEQNVPMVYTSRVSLLIELARISGHVWETYGSDMVSCNDPPRCMAIEERDGGIHVLATQFWETTAREKKRKYGAFKGRWAASCKDAENKGVEETGRVDLSCFEEVFDS
ncbi:hypothetical protein KIPB_012443, partial [Kipferlia bialata]